MPYCFGISYDSIFKNSLLYDSNESLNRVVNRNQMHTKKRSYTGCPRKIETEILFRNVLLMPQEILQKILMMNYYMH